MRVVNDPVLFNDPVLCLSLRKSCCAHCRDDGYSGPWYSDYLDAVEHQVKKPLREKEDPNNFELFPIVEDVLIYDGYREQFRVSPEFWTGDKQADLDAVWDLAQKFRVPEEILEMRKKDEERIKKIKEERPVVWFFLKKLDMLCDIIDRLRGYFIMVGVACAVCTPTMFLIFIEKLLYALGSLGNL